MKRALAGAWIVVGVVLLVRVAIALTATQSTLDRLEPAARSIAGNVAGLRNLDRSGAASDRSRASVATVGDRMDELSARFQNMERSATTLARVELSTERSVATSARNVSRGVVSARTIGRTARGVRTLTRPRRHR